VISLIPAWFAFLSILPLPCLADFTMDYLLPAVGALPVTVLRCHVLFSGFWVFFFFSFDLSVLKPVLVLHVSLPFSVVVMMNSGVHFIRYIDQYYSYICIAYYIIHSFDK